MPVDRTLESFFEEASRGRAASRETEAPPLRNAGGGGTSGGMEARLARLEADMDHVKSTLTELRAEERETRGVIDIVKSEVAAIKMDFAIFRSEAKHFATKTFSVVTAIAIIVALSAVIVFADQLRRLAGFP